MRELFIPCSGSQLDSPFLQPLTKSLNVQFMFVVVPTPFQIAGMEDSYLHLALCLPKSVKSSRE